MAFVNPNQSKADWALMSLVGGLLLLASHASAADSEAKGAVRDKHGDWVTRCETPPARRTSNARSCSASSTRTGQT